MKFIRFLLIVISMFSVSARPAPDSVFPEITAGLTEAVVGLNPQPGAPSGWYTSDVTLHILAPADVLANGKPLPGGQLTISDEGQHEVELQPGPAGQANTVTQFVSIDKTPPRVTWLTAPQVHGSVSLILDAEITDATSGVCLIEASFDHGATWDGQSFPALAPGKPGDLYETDWSMQLDLLDFPQGAQLVLLRAWDCAGNVSPGEILVVRVE